jgi:uncharacterized protein (DUF58 family)
LVFDPSIGAGGEDAFEAAVSLAATIAAEWRGERGGRLIAVVAGDDPVILDGLAGSAHVRRVLESLAVVEPVSSLGTSGTLLDRLTATPAAAIVVVGVGRGDLADKLRDALRRPVSHLNAATLSQLNFYEPPINDAN